MEFHHWYNYFESNKNHFDHIDWKGNQLLSEEEKKIITSSLQSFQRGEHSEGKNFLKFAAALKDNSYTDTLKMFIKEEQDHAFVLGKFMMLNNIPKIDKDKIDGIFRRLRKLAGLECTVTVLLTAEIIAMVYYKALCRATSSQLLKGICDQVLEDEKRHLEFQSDTLRVIYRRKSGFSILLSRVVHKILMLGTIGVVWFVHKKVLKAGFYTINSFFSDTWIEFKKCEQTIKEKPVLNLI